MTDLQTTDLIESPFTKVNKGMEIVGNWPKYIRALADEITDCVVNVINIIESMVHEILDVQPTVVVE